MISRHGAWTRLLRRPFAALIPMAGLVMCLTGVLAGIHLVVVMPVQQRLARLQTEWRDGRQRFVQHAEAKRALQDLAEVLRMIPARQDFVPLALGITEEATRNNVSLPSLSYRMEASSGELAAKAVFAGSATGRYEDVRRFIRRLELADELLFIEDLDVVRSGPHRAQNVTFKMEIATYLRKPPQRERAESS